MFKSPSEFLLLIVLIAGISYVSVRLAQPPSQMPASFPIEQAQQPPTTIVVQGGDDRYSIAPRPQRYWDRSAGSLPSIATRGAPDDYQQMGIVTGADGKLLPLYGRRVAPRSDYFNYYTRTDTYNPIPLPITFNKRDCQDNAGCKEVYTGDEVRISPTGDTGKVTLYGFDGPRY